MSTKWLETENTSENSADYSAFRDLMGMITPIPDLDDEKELAEYREEKYGK